MGAPMLIDTTEITECTETEAESMAERMSRSPLSLVETLRYATEIATALRDLHEHGLTYGAVTSQSILLEPLGAALRATGDIKRLGDGRRDVMAYGTVLEEMLAHQDTAGAGEDSIRDEARALALRCRHEAPGMKHVVINLRLLALAARQCEKGLRIPAPAVLRAPVPPAESPAAPAPPAVPVVAPVRPAPPVRKPRARARVRVRIRLNLHWKPLVSLAVVTLSGK